MVMVTRTKTMVERRPGQVTFVNCAQASAPSMRAAS